VSGVEVELAGRVVDLVRRVAGPGAEVEALADHRALALTRFANSFIHQNVAEAVTTVRVRVHSDGRTATGSTTVISGDGLTALVERTLAAARLCPPDPAWPGLAAPAQITATARWDAATAQAGPDDRAMRVRAFVDAAGGLEAAGYCRTVHRSSGFANSAGQFASGRTTEAAMDGIVRADGADGVARMTAVRLAGIDGAKLGARAAIKARAGGRPVEITPGRYEVVLESAAVADLLQNLGRHGLSGKAYNERRTFAEPGTTQFDQAITIVDDALGGGGGGLPFDADGTPKRRTVLVDAGLTAALAHDRRSAAEAGTQSTGHAVPAGAGWGPIPLHLRLLPAGGAAGGSDAADETPGPAADAESATLVTGVERGILISDLWYTRVLDPRSLVVTGLTRNGVWLIEDGQIITALRDLRFTQSYPEALAPGMVLGVGMRAAVLPDNWDCAWTSAPALRLASWHITGGASG